MKHDELLEKINNLSCCSGGHELALRAVVELHKPQEITLPDGSWGANCVQCDGWDYPCLTIQAIEKELK